MSVLKCLFGINSVLGSGRLVDGLVRRPLLNQLVMAERSYVNPSEMNNDWFDKE